LQVASSKFQVAGCGSGEGMFVGWRMAVEFRRMNESGIRNLCRGIAIKYGENLAAGRLGPVQGELVTVQFRVVLTAPVDTVYSGLDSK